MSTIIAAIIPPLAVAIFMAWFNKKQAARDNAVEQRAEARKRESLLSMELQSATAKLAYAVAMAHKRGEPNGEIEEGITAYEDATTKYETFLREQTADKLIS